ncbi:hypothetical protein ACLOJK_019233 [Asimina triloba]
MRSDLGQQLRPNSDGLKPISPSTRPPPEASATHQLRPSSSTAVVSINAVQTAPISPIFIPPSSRHPRSIPPICSAPQQPHDLAAPASQRPAIISHPSSDDVHGKSSSAHHRRLRAGISDLRSNQLRADPQIRRPTAISTQQRHLEQQEKIPVARSTTPSFIEHQQHHLQATTQARSRPHPSRIPLRNGRARQQNHLSC